MPGKYINRISDFLNQSKETVLGFLSLGVTNHQLLFQQRKSWDHQIILLKSVLQNLPSNWYLIFEYPIPRRSKRIDLIIIAHDLIFVIEFKDQGKTYSSEAITQVEDYALDLRDFHKESFGRNLIPIVWASEAKDVQQNLRENGDFVKPVLFANNSTLFQIISSAFNFYSNQTIEEINPVEWDNSEYLPTPTIIEAAQHLFAGQSVKEISRSHAGSENLTSTTNSILKAISLAQSNDEKIICFITGVPGAGKTLAGLNIVHNVENNSGKGVFLSGNGPLVKVLTEALARDNAKRRNISVTESRREVAFVKNVHHFLDFYHSNDQVPPDKIVLFDEAQRAWNAEQSKRKFDRDFSEAEMLLSIMNRNSGWAVIVALIGSGQEINTGEAGLSEWGKTISDKFQKWKIFISPELKEGSSRIANHNLFEKTPTDLSITEMDELHLKVSIRSYKAEKLSEWIAAVLDDEPNKAKSILQNYLIDYPIFLTRNLEEARRFLREKNRGHRRSGLIASSGAKRLRPLGLDVINKIDVENWFLNPKEDVRSSSFLEIVATEFDVQGLELDWVGLCWGDDFRKEEIGWSYHAFKGTKWQLERQEARKQFIKNKYRVLLTRAREGMVIFIPEGSKIDHTRPKSNYDSTFKYLVNIGIKELKI
ncbi:DNA/RNA helicase domain-containing protein [uncultured Algoriphagus sp.]|uniref:DUF2075 domain-containing protein n=1 Tax=uncultured Algoriphagus sp. TaxID=417365 RepID=UPI00258AB151|nr:DNA/RNA helicase domain-containing protein [uncultured Algoriphagus sp.]